MKFQGQKVEPIHLNRLLQGKLRHHSERDKSADRSVNHTTPYIQLMAIKNGRHQEIRAKTRQGGICYSYRRWYDSSPPPTFMMNAVRSMTPTSMPDRRMEQPVQLQTDKQPITPQKSFRRTLKTLREKVREKLKNMLPEQMGKLEVLSHASEEELRGLTANMCNKITPWRMHIRSLSTRTPGRQTS